MRVRFGDVVVRANTKEDRFNTDKLYYVGGEHIETGEYLVTKRGLIAGSNIGPMFYFGFRKGQVLLASRSPDLKKAGMVTFDGICSEKTFVIETRNENVLLQSFLPIIVRSEAFWEYANNNQSGSVNHFINWSTFSAYEFDLPSLEEQRQLSEIVWAMVDAQRAYKALIAASDELVKSQFVEMFKGGRYPIVKAQDVCEFITKGTTPPSNEIFSEPPDEPIPYLKVYNLSFDGSLLFQEEPQYIQRDIHEGKLARSKVYPNDVLMNIVGPPLGKFSLVTDEYPEWNINQAIAIFRAKKQIIPVFLLYALMQPDVLKPFLDSAQGVRQLNLSLEQCRSLEFPLPPMSEQQAFVSFANLLNKSKYVARKVTYLLHCVL